MYVLLKYMRKNITEVSSFHAREREKKSMHTLQMTKS